MQKDNSETVKWIAIGVVGVTALVFAYFGIIKPIFNAIGLTDSKEDRDANQAIDKFSREQYLSSLPYSQNKSKVTINQTKANQLAMEIYDSKGLFYDTEAQAVGAIKDAITKINVSYVAYRFKALYQRDLFTYLKSFLENEDWTELWTAIGKMKMN